MIARRTQHFGDLECWEGEVAVEGEGEVVEGDGRGGGEGAGERDGQWENARGQPFSSDQ